MTSQETFGGELAKQIPIKEVYADLVHPTLSTAGQALQGVTKIALAPVAALVWGYDRIGDYLNVAIPEYFAKRKVKKERIVTPDPSIAVPLIEAMRYTAHKSELREMFTNLLGASMDAENIDGHPAFVEIIKQLCSDECKMLKYLFVKPIMPMLKVRRIVNTGGEVDITPYFSDIGFLSGCKHPQKFPEYLDNLHRLGLVEIEYDRYLYHDSNYAQLRENPHFKGMIPTDSYEKEERKSLYKLSELGKKFCFICIE